MLQLLTAEVYWLISLYVSITNTHWSEFKNSLKLMLFLLAGLDRGSVLTWNECLQIAGLMLVRWW